MSSQLLTRGALSAFLLLTYGILSYSLWNVAVLGGVPFMVLSAALLVLAVGAVVGFVAFRSHWSWVAVLVETIVVTELFFVLGIVVLLQLMAIGWSAPVASLTDIVYVYGPPVFVVLGAACISTLIADTRLANR